MFEKGTAMFHALGGTKDGACRVNAPRACGTNLLPLQPWPMLPTPCVWPKFAMCWLRPPPQPPRHCFLCPALPPPPCQGLNPSIATAANSCCTGIVSCWIGGWYCRVGGGGVRWCTTMPPFGSSAQSGWGWVSWLCLQLILRWLCCAHGITSMDTEATH